MITAKHYNEVAKRLHNIVVNGHIITKDATIKAITVALSEIYSKDNPRFDAERFKEKVLKGKPRTWEDAGETAAGVVMLLGPGRTEYANVCYGHYDKRYLDGAMAIWAFNEEEADQIYAEWLEDNRVDAG